MKKRHVLTLVGPRQSGKTTLIRTLFSSYSYVSLEDPDHREMAKFDPRGFLNQQAVFCIIDEIQRVPELTSYIQTIVDSPNNKRKFILTGSNGLMLIDSVTQTLAGRTDVFELYPLSYFEIIQKNPSQSLNDFLFRGGYPRIYKEDLNSTKWLKDYFQLYVEKDVRQITNITNIDLFEKFIRLAAGRVGQLLNAASLGNEVGVTGPTITGWLSALKSTFICFTLMPHHKNFNKRIIKTPKIYFYDTGLLCYLLGINSAEQLNVHPLRGSIFENFIISEHLKMKSNQGQESRFYFWRDQKGHEIDLVDDRSLYLYPIEIKMSETFNPRFLDNLKFFNELQAKELGTISPKGELIYTGIQDGVFLDYLLNPWRNVLS